MKHTSNDTRQVSPAGKLGNYTDGSFVSLCPVSIGSQQISSHIFLISLFTIYFKSNTYIEGLIYVKHMSTFTWQVSPAVKLVCSDRLLHSDHMHGHDHIMNFLYSHEMITKFTENVRDHYLGNEY